MTETTAAAVPATDVAPDHAARNRLVIGLLLAATFVVILNETVMSVALPRLMAAFTIDANAAQWVSTAFMLTMAVVIPITGFLLQRYSTRSIFILAMSLFTLGTLAAALAPAFPLLIVARVIQASGTAIMLPLLFTTVLTLVAENARGRVMGNISIVISVAPAIGPLVGGLILQAFAWYFMFWFVLPIAAAALIIGIVRVPNVTEPRKIPLDYLSVVLSAFGFGGLVYGLSNLGPLGIGALVTWLPLAVSVVALTFFILRQLALQKRDAALLDLRTFSIRAFAVTSAMITVSMMGLFGAIILLPLYTQGVLGLDTATSGLLLLPGGLLMGLAAPFVGRLYDKVGPRPLVVPGAIVVSIALWGFTLFGPNTGAITVALTYLVLTAGFALLFTPLFTTGLGALPGNLYSHGSAMVGTIQQIAGAAGVALFITVMTAVASVAKDAGDTGVSMAGIHVAFIAGAAISLITIPLTFFLRKPPAQEWGEAPAGH
jgi:MFS transporter, DHA2 family, lincomycin resistance protein